MPLLTRAFFALLRNTSWAGEIVCNECADIYVGMCAPVCIVKCVGNFGVPVENLVMGKKYDTVLGNDCEH